MTEFLQFVFPSVKMRKQKEIWRGKNCVSPSEKKRFPGEFSFHVWNRVTKKSGEKCLLARNVFRLALMCSTHSKWMSQVEFLKKEKNIRFFFTQFHMKRKKRNSPENIFFGYKNIHCHAFSTKKCFAWKKWNISPKKMFKSVSHMQEKEKIYFFPLKILFYIFFHEFVMTKKTQNISVEFFSHEKRQNIFVSWNVVFIWFHTVTQRNSPGKEINFHKQKN